MVDRATPVTPDAPDRGRVRTIPNLVSFARLAGVPLFLWLFLGVEADGWAVAVLAIGGTSDWVDGFLARRLGQVSRLGEMLDPLADRLYILATLLALTIRDVLPWWFTIALLAREAVLLVSLAVPRRYGYATPARHRRPPSSCSWRSRRCCSPPPCPARTPGRTRAVGHWPGGPGSVLGRGRVLPRATAGAVREARA